MGDYGSARLDYQDAHAADERTQPLVFTPPSTTPVGVITTALGQAFGRLTHRNIRSIRRAMKNGKMDAISRVT